MECFIGGALWECLGHLLNLGERQIHRVIAAYGAYFNASCPHQGIGQRVPCGPPTPGDTLAGSGRFISLPVFDGLHHDYRNAP